MIRFTRRILALPFWAAFLATAAVGLVLGVAAILVSGADHD